MILTIAAPALILIGLSQIYKTEFWQSYYRWLASLGSLGVRLNGLISLSIGSPIVIFHNVWSGPPILLTLFGWMLLTESALCLFLPGAGLAGLAEVEDEARSRIIVGTGAALVIIGGVLAAHLLRTSG